MADRLTRLAGVLALSMCLAGSSACGASDTTPTASLLSSAGVAAAVTVAIFRTLNDAVVDDYVLETLSQRSGPVGDTQACLSADNRISQRPSALANPPYAQASILQRDRVVRVLGAYAFALASATGDATADSSFAAAEFERASYAFGIAANSHAQGDLFVEDGAAMLAAVARDIHNARDRGEMRDVLTRAAPAVRQLIVRVRSDVAKRRLAAIRATQLDFQDLLAYGASDPEHPATTARAAAGIPCGRPFLPEGTEPPGADPANPSPATASFDRLPPGVRSRAEGMRDRAQALSMLDLDSVFQALLEEIDAASALPLQSVRVVDSVGKMERAATSAAKVAIPLLTAPM